MSQRLISINEGNVWEYESDKTCAIERAIMVLIRLRSLTWYWFGKLPSTFWHSSNVRNFETIAVECRVFNSSCT